MISIILALVLLAVLLVVCGPLVYKKLVKRCKCWCLEPPPFQASTAERRWLHSSLTEEGPAPREPAEDPSASPPSPYPLLPTSLSLPKVAES